MLVAERQRPVVRTDGVVQQEGFTLGPAQADAEGSLSAGAKRFDGSAGQAQLGASW
jgi:hypothetical protein